MVDFLKHTWFYFLFSSLILVPGIFSLLKFGLKPSIDFVGGSRWEIVFLEEKVEKQKLDQFLSEKAAADFLGSESGSSPNSYLIRLKPIDESFKGKLSDLLTNDLGKFREERFEVVGPAMSGELLRKTAAGVILAAVLILFYVAYRFKDKIFGISAILAMLHDSLVILGIFSILGHFLQVEVDLLFVTAFLTILSFSVHDTIVVFDRIREQEARNPKMPIRELANLAINQTMTRSFNNSLTILLMLGALIVFGGETTRWFAAALFIGTISGTYSSPFTAIPILVLWQENLSKK